MALTAQGSTFTFTSRSAGSFSAGVTRVTVETPRAEILSVAGLYDPTGAMINVGTGATTGGSIDVEFIAKQGSVDAQPFVGKSGSVSFSGRGFSISRNVILESASVTGTVGDVIRGRLSFVPTDWNG